MSARIEFHEPRRTPRRPVTPQRVYHNGIVFQNGTVHTGSKAHVNVPKDNIKDLGSTSAGGSSSRTPIFSVGGTLDSKLAQLPSTRPNASPRPVRAPTPVQSPTGKRFINPGDSGDVVGHSKEGSRSSPMRNTGRAHATVPADSFIPGINEAATVRTDSPARRGMRHMEGPPPFQPDPYVPRSYTPQLRRDHRPSDSGLFSSNGAPAENRSTTPLRTGRRQGPAQQSHNIITWEF